MNVDANAHLELDVLAQCAEGALAAEDAARVREHLVGCRSCMAAYVDAIRYRAAWLVDLESLHAGGSDRRRARALAQVSRRPTRSPRRRVVQGFAILGTAAAVTLGIAVWNGRIDLPSLGSRPDPSAPAHRSTGGLVLPGSVGPDADVQPEMRSGLPMGGVELEREVKSSLEAYEAGARGEANGTRLIAALLAEGETETARDYATECVRLHPTSVPLMLFAADAYDRTGDLDGAERLARRASRLAPRDPVVTLDLALILRDRGAVAESRRLFANVARAPMGPLVARARRELAARP